MSIALSAMHSFLRRTPARRRSPRPPVCPAGDQVRRIVRHPSL